MWFVIKYIMPLPSTIMAVRKQFQNLQINDKKCFFISDITSPGCFYFFSPTWPIEGSTSYNPRLELVSPATYPRYALTLKWSTPILLTMFYFHGCFLEFVWNILLLFITLSVTLPFNITKHWRRQFLLYVKYSITNIRRIGGWRQTVSCNIVESKKAFTGILAKLAVVVN